MSMNHLRLDRGDQISAGTKYRWYLPRLPGWKVESDWNDRGSRFLILGRQPGRRGRQGDANLKAQRAQDTHLLVHPTGANSCFYNVQNFHETAGAQFWATRPRKAIRRSPAIFTIADGHLSEVMLNLLLLVALEEWRSMCTGISHASSLS